LNRQNRRLALREGVGDPLPVAGLLMRAGRIDEFDAIVFLGCPQLVADG
jgi:hypothetical protein